MAYCSQEDIEAEIPQASLIQLTDDAVPPAAVIQAVIDKAIADAGDVIDGYVGSRYQLPITVVPALVKTIAVDVAVYKLFMRRKMRAVPAGVQAAYDNSMKLLRDIQAEKITLGATPTGGAVPTVATGTAQVTSSPRIFTRDRMRGF